MTPEDPGSRSAGAAVHRARVVLAAICVLPAVLEVGLVLVLLPQATPNLAPQITAVAPFGLFHDLRWLSVYTSSWPTFGALAAGVLAVRGVLTGISVRLAWPGSVPPPPTARLLARGVVATLGAGVLLVPSVTVLFGLAVVPVSWLFLAAVPLALAVALVVHPVAVAGGWWRRSIPWRGLGWMLASFVALTVAAAVIAAVPGWAAGPVAAAAGLFNARAWVGAVGAVVDPRRPHRVLPVVPVSLTAMVVVVIAGSLTGFTQAAPGASRPEPGDVRPSRGAQPVLLVHGYGSHWDGTTGHPLPGRYAERTFSYAGLGPSGRPLPYRGSDTVRSLPALDAEMAEQVAKLHRETGRPVDIVAESEGALVTETYLVSEPDPPVGTVVLVSPLLGPGRVSYPVGAAVGVGLPARQAMQALTSLYQSVAPIDLDPDSPFLVSLDRLAPLLDQVMECPVPGVRQFGVLPLADATAAPVHISVPFPTAVVPAFHGGLIGGRSVDGVVVAALDGRMGAGGGPLGEIEEIVAASAAAWQVPALAPSAFPRPVPPGQSTAADCSALARAIAAG